MGEGKSGREDGRLAWRREARELAEWAMKGAMTGAAASALGGIGKSDLALGAGTQWAAVMVWSKGMEG